MPMQPEGKEVSAVRITMMVQQRQQCLWNFGIGTSATRATMPLWQWQKRLRIDNGDDTIVTRATASAWQWQWHHHNKGNNAIAETAKWPGLQWRLGIDNGNTITTRTTMPAWQQQRRLRIEDGNNPIVTRRQHQPNDYTSSTMAEMPLQQGQQLSLRQWQRCLCMNGNNVMRATKPLQWRQGWLCINVDDDTIAVGSCQS